MTWTEFVREEKNKDYFVNLVARVEEDKKLHTVYPPCKDIFSAFETCPYEETRVVILGQDPYHGLGQAHGLAFSVLPGEPVPPSLRNIHKELKSDLDIDAPSHGNLSGWSRQGVLLLNSFLTVRDGQPGSHKSFGWETFTDNVISHLNEFETTVAFVLWGGFARSKKKLITKQSVIESVHPSPLSAYNGFFGSKPFSKVNQILTQANLKPIDWKDF